MERVRVELGDLTLNANGYYAIPSGKFPGDGKWVIGAVLAGWTSVTPIGCINIVCETNSAWIMGTANANIRGLRVIYFTRP